MTRRTCSQEVYSQPEAGETMDTDDSRVGGSPPDGPVSRSGGDQLSRRQALHRLGLGVAGGAAVWAAPEILIGRPTPAGAASAAPGSGPVRPAGGGTSTGDSGSGPVAVAPTTGQPGADPGSADSAAGPSGKGGGGQLAFTGVNAERAVELGAGLLAGGWALTRWSGRGDGAGADDQPTGQAPQPS
jgi:hypothetical protein